MVTHMLARASPDENIRPFLIHQDLAQLASLIELAFRPELERVGDRIPAEMRRLARAGPLLRLLDTSHGPLSSLMGGYVWVANGQLVGNVTLTQESSRRNLWSIGNVAVHPDFRGRGIARRLMGVALQEAGDRGARVIVLEVNTDNTAAQQLYRGLGFEVYETVEELSLPAHSWPKATALPSLPLRKRRPDDWEALYNLVRTATPTEAQKVRPVSVSHFRMGIDLRFARWLDDLTNRRRRTDWVLEKKTQVVAWLQLTGQYRRETHRLQITVHPESRGMFEDQMLTAGLYRLSRFPVAEVVSRVPTSHPEAQQAYHSAGFRAVRVLDQMRLDLRRAKDGTTP
jgi:ribosomal protein S18 acetylase RimI-like enzyme